MNMKGTKYNELVCRWKIMEQKINSAVLKS